MTRLFVITTATLTGIIGVLVGLLLSLQRRAAGRRAPAPAAVVGERGRAADHRGRRSRGRRRPRLARTLPTSPRA